VLSQEPVTKSTGCRYTSHHQLDLGISMLLFHGTRKSFSKFDPSFFGTGEGGVCVGFYFTESLKGAYNHASSYAPGTESPLVYVCRINGPFLMLDKEKPISEQAPEVQQHWETLPLANYLAKSHRDWFGNLFKTLPFGNLQLPPMELETYTYNFLRRTGFDVIYDGDGPFTDAYQFGPSVIVLNESKIEIVEVLPVEHLHEETVGVPKEYELADFPASLGTTGLQSHLRRVQTR
jgi:hypothetical protein